MSNVTAFVKIHLILCLFFPLTLRAAKKEDSFDKRLIKENISISNKVDVLADVLDEFLSGGQLTKKVNRTTLIFRNNFIINERDNFQYVPHFDVRLHLPNLEEKWRLKFSSYDDSEQRSINRNRLRTKNFEKRYNAGVGFFSKLGDIDTEFQPQIDIREKLGLSYLLKFSNNTDMGKFVLRPKLELFAKSDSGIGEFLSLNLTYVINDRWNITWVNEEQYTDRENVFATNEGIKINNMLTDTMFQEHGFIYELNNRPNYHLERYVLSTAFMHQLYKRVLHYMVIPYLAFEEEYGFRAGPGINFEIEIIF